MNIINSSLCICGLELQVFLGWPQEERQTQQVVLLDMTIVFATPPKACETDNLEDAYCYDALTKLIQKQIALKSYRLIEHLGCEIYNIAKAFFSSHDKIAVKIIKHPDIPGLTGGASFSYGDLDL